MKYSYLSTIETENIHVEIFAFEDVDLIFVLFDCFAIEIVYNEANLQIMDKIVDEISEDSTCTNDVVLNIFEGYFNLD